MYLFDVILVVAISNVQSTSAMLFKIVLMARKTTEAYSQHDEHLKTTVFLHISFNLFLVQIALPVPVVQHRVYFIFLLV